MRRARKGLALLQAFAACLFLLPCTGAAHGSIGVIVGEPFGAFGTMMPTGHTSIFLDHICAATPTSFRPCAPGEAGVVLSRYHDLRPSQLDWFAVPVVPFFYGVEDVSQTPVFVTPQRAASLRDQYRHAHLLPVLPDSLDATGHLRPPPTDEWGEGVGAAFDRRLFLYEVDTTPEQDAALLAWLNSLPDRRRYSLAHANCANFAADAVNFLFPGAVRRNHLGDFNLMTPKQVARAMERFGFDHPELHLRMFEVPQLPGSLRRSRPLRGASEMFLKTKRYLAALLILQPEAIAADWIVYEKSDKWSTGEDSVELDPQDWPRIAANNAAEARRSAARACPGAQLSAPGSDSCVMESYSLPSSRSTASSAGSPSSIGLRAK